MPQFVVTILNKKPVTNEMTCRKYPVNFVVSQGWKEEEDGKSSVKKSVIVKKSVT